MEKVKDLNYWKNNCEEDYLHTPISVLRYITELEKKVEVAINFVHSSLPLKEKEAMTFEEFLKNEKIEKIGLLKYINREGYNVSLAELTKIHQRYKANL